MYATKSIDVTHMDEPAMGYPTKYIPAGSSTDESDMDEILDYVFSKRIKYEKEPLYQNIRDLLEIDLSSRHPHFEIKNESSSIQENVEKTVPLQLSEEEIVMEMVGHDIIPGLPPKRRYKVELKIRNIRRGKPKIVAPEVF